MYIGKFNIPSKFLISLAILLIGLLFFYKSYIFVDPDFGWHLKMGEIILKQGFPLTDPFSYTMPSFPFVDHEWLTNVIFYTLYQTTGTIGLAGVMAIIGLSLILIIKSQNKSNYFLAPLLLSAPLLLIFWGIRPQMETLLLTAILLKIVTGNLWPKWKWFLPLLFLLWANLHGGFSGGLVILYLFLGLKSISQRKIIAGDIILALICTGITLINPYGINLWREVWQQMSDGNLRFSIMEWASFVQLPGILLLIFIPLLALSGALIFHFRKKLTLSLLGTYFFLLILSVSSQRHIPLWVVAALPITTWGLNQLFQTIKSIKLGQQRFTKAYRALLVFSFFFFAVSAFFEIKSVVAWQEKFYPQKAIEFIRQFSPDKRIFNYYGWGGYIIRELPGQKVFIDGRMPSWRWQPPSQNESAAVFDEYNKLVYDAKDLKILDKYSVQLVLWLTSFSDTPTFKKRLEQSHWKKIYQDNIAVIYQRP